MFGLGTWGAELSLRASQQMGHPILHMRNSTSERKFSLQEILGNPKIVHALNRRDVISCPHPEFWINLSSVVIVAGHDGGWRGRRGRGTPDLEVDCCSSCATGSIGGSRSHAPICAAQRRRKLLSSPLHVIARTKMLCPPRHRLRQDAASAIAIAPPCFPLSLQPHLPLCPHFPPSLPPHLPLRLCLPLSLPLHLPLRHHFRHCCEREREEKDKCENKDIEVCIVYS